MYGKVIDELLYVDTTYMTRVIAREEYVNEWRIHMYTGYQNHCHRNE
jgi:hypothetical protein